MLCNLYWSLPATRALRHVAKQLKTILMIFNYLVPSCTEAADFWSSHCCIVSILCTMAAKHTLRRNSDYWPSQESLSNNVWKLKLCIAINVSKLSAELFDIAVAERKNVWRFVYCLCNKARSRRIRFSDEWFHTKRSESYNYLQSVCQVIHPC